MAEKFPKHRRLIEIVYILSRGGKKSASEIREHLQNTFGYKVNVRAVQRDMNDLKKCLGTNLNVEGEVNTGFRYSLDKGGIITPRSIKTFVANEVLAAYLFKNLGNLFKGTEIERAYKNLLNKIEDRLPEDVFEFVDSRQPSLQNLISVKPFGNYDIKTKELVIDRLVKAITGKKAIEMDYSFPQKTYHKTCHPFRIIVSKGVPYLVALDVTDNIDKTFSISKISKVQLLPKSFVMSQQSKDKLERILTSGIGIYYHEGSKIEKVVLRFDSCLSEQILHRDWHPSQKPKILKNGSIELVMTLPVTEELLGWILYWQNLVTVMKPKSLAKQIAQKAQDIQGLY